MRNMYEPINAAPQRDPRVLPGRKTPAYYGTGPDDRERAAFVNEVLARLRGQVCPRFLRAAEENKFAGGGVDGEALPVTFGLGDNTQTVLASGDALHKALGIENHSVAGSIPARQHQVTVYDDIGITHEGVTDSVLTGLLDLALRKGMVE